VDRQPRGDRGQERGRFADLVALRVLPPQPRLLDDVLRFDGAAEDPVGDAEEPRPRRLEIAHGPVQRIARAINTHIFPPLSRTMLQVGAAVRAQAYSTDVCCVTWPLFLSQIPGLSGLSGRENPAIGVQPWPSPRRPCPPSCW